MHEKKGGLLIKHVRYLFNVFLFFRDGRKAQHRRDSVPSSQPCRAASRSDQKQLENKLQIH